VKRNIAAVLVLAALVLAFGTFLNAQQAPVAPGNAQVTPQQVDDAAIQLMRQDVRADRKKVVAANMPLTADEATKFWPVYDRYIADATKINDVRYALIKEYAQNYDKMTDAQANGFINRWIKLDGDVVQLRLKYIPEFEKVVSPKKTAMFCQIDRRVSMMIELQLAAGIPLVKP
jgi:hypothetical protein